MNRLKILFAFLFSILYSQCIACSGDSGAKRMWENETLARTSLVVCITLALVTMAIQIYLKLFRTSFLYNPLIVILAIVLHPINWLDVYGGDCGNALGEFSIYAILVVGIILIITGIKAGEIMIH